MRTFHKAIYRNLINKSSKQFILKSNLLFAIQLGYIYFTVTMLKLSFSICFAIMSILVYGQHFYFRQYQVENGLSNNMVTCSVQDAKGFLWFGSRDGLDRFDGYTFKVFRSDINDKNSIGNSKIRCLCADAEGKIWVGTQKGLFHFNPENESFQLLVMDTLAVISDMQLDSQKNLWFISGGILTKYDTRTGKLTYFGINRYFKATSLCFINSQLWVSTTEGMLEKYNTTTNTFQSFDLFKDALPIKHRWIEKLYATSDGDLLIGTASDGAKIFFTKGQYFKNILTYSEDNSPLFVKAFIQISQKEYWIGTESGIYKYNKETGEISNIRKKHNDPYSLSDNSINTFCRDRDSGLWVGTNYGGINNYSKKFNVFEKYFPRDLENSLSGNVVREIHEDSTGNLWIGTEDAGFNKMEVSTGKFTNFQPDGSKSSISYKNIHAILIDGGNLWIGTYIHGLHVMDIKTGKIIKRYTIIKEGNSLLNDFCMHRTVDGQVFIGTISGVYMYNRDMDDFSLITGLPNDWYACILKDNKGRLWAGSFANGLSYLNVNNGKKATFKYDIKNQKSIGSSRINSIFNDSRGQLWFATEGGLCLYNEQTHDFKRYTTENGLPSNFILNILEDDRRNLWLATTSGLVCFNQDNGHVRTYTKENGILNNQFTYSSACKTQNGKMYFGSVKGMIGFDPKALSATPIDEPIYITGFQVNNEELQIGHPNSPLQKSITWSKEIVLKHNQSSFSIDFAALNYTAPEATEYAYAMEGLEKDWTYLKANRKVYFTDLSPGTYIFKVKASIADDDWMGKECTLTIRILSPWWLSIYAYLFYMVVGIATVVLLVRNYNKRAQNRNKREIEKMNVIREKEMYEDKFNFFTNVAHEIKTPLTLIKGPLESVIKEVGDMPEIAESLKIMDRNANRLVDLTNQFLDFRQTEIKGFSLNFIKVNISEMLMETFENFRPLVKNQNLNCTINLPNEPIFAWIDMDAFSKILTNLFSNAVKYAEGKIEINLIGHEEGIEFFNIEISNDGFVIPEEMSERIFEPFFRLKETKKHKGTGIGLALSLSLAKLHKGMITLKNEQLDMNTFLLTMPTAQD